MAALFWRRLAMSGVVATVAALTLSLGVVQAHEVADGLAPTFDLGAVVVEGTGFRPHERVTITVTIDGPSVDYTTQAGPDGDVFLRTNASVRPGQSVMVQARGDEGTVRAAMATAPPEVGLPRPIALLRNAAAQPAGQALLIVVGAGLGGSLLGAALARRRPAA